MTMQILDRNRPMRAIHRKTGEAGHVEKVNESKALTVGKGLDQYQTYFDRYGNPKDDFCPWRVENVPDAVDWSKAIESVFGDIVRPAYKTSGPVISWAKVQRPVVAVQIEGWIEVWVDEETGQCGEYGYIRNVQSCIEGVSPDTIQAAINKKAKEYRADMETETVNVDKALWERVVGLVRTMNAAGDDGYAWDRGKYSSRHYDEARAIAELLGPLIDPESEDEENFWHDVAIEDTDENRMAVKAAIKYMRGRALERGE